jgi:5-methylthioribose kinase
MRRGAPHLLFGVWFVLIQVATAIAEQIGTLLKVFCDTLRSRKLPSIVKIIGRFALVALLPTRE